MYGWHHNVPMAGVYLYVCPVRDRKLRTGVATWKFSGST